MDFTSFSPEAPIRLGFHPSGVYDENGRSYTLKFEFTATQEEGAKLVVQMECEAVFEFADRAALEDIPEYFYPNSLAIVFPYVRAFISTVTLQANMEAPIVIPTLNLSGLKSELKENTKRR